MTESQSSVVANIITIMTNTSLTEPFYELVLLRLDSLGYELNEDEVWSLCFAMQKVETHVKNFCNINVVPESAYTIVCDMVCGEFLTELKQLNKLEGFDVEAAVKQVHLGDTTVSFADTLDNFSALTNSLMHREGDLLCYRQLRW